VSVDLSELSMSRSSIIKPNGVYPTRMTLSGARMTAAGGSHSSELSVADGKGAAHAWKAESSKKHKVANFIKFEFMGRLKCRRY
jgi:hypothetical protein